jgi:hypothetical protein
MLLAAIAAGLWARHLARVQYQRDQAEALSIISGRMGSNVLPDAIELTLPDGFDEKELRYVTFLPRLQRLTTSGTDISVGELRHLEKLPELRELKLRNAKLTEDALVRLTELRQLRRLDLLDTHISQQGLENLCRITQLQSLVIHLPTDAQTDPLRNLSQLEYLRLAAGGAVRGRDLEFLAAMPKLRTFWLQCSIEGDVLASLRHVPQLTELRLQANQLRDADLQFIRNHTQLRHLTLESNSGNFVTDAGLPCLDLMRHLRFLNLSHCREISDQGVARLAQFHNPRTLRLRWTSITDCCAPDLAKMTRIENLGLATTDITVSGLEQIVKLPKLRTVDMPGGVSDEEWHQVRERYPHLRFY